jgi:hypothetical protein
MRADRIEVAQRRDAPRRIGDFEIAQDLFGDELRLAVRIGRGKRKRFVDRHALRHAVDRRGGTEHEVAHVALLHHLQHGEQAADVVAVILDRLRHRFAHGFERREVNRAGDLVRVENAIERGFVARVGFVECDALSRDALDTL